MAGSANPKWPRRVNYGVTAAVCAVFVAGMVGMSYAAVPLYRIFCQATGYGGTTRRAEFAPKTIVDRVVTVRFDSNISNNLGWSFRPLQRSVQVKLGQVDTVSFEAENRTDRTETGTAAFNVTPDQAGAYFNKIACFCFTEQTLKPGQKTDLGVTFFVDPSYANDPNLQNIDTVTLSYSFYPATPKPVASAATTSGENPL
jgi:cytochrome c oxidase assembly protein subunit 11